MCSLSLTCSDGRNKRSGHRAHTNMASRLGLSLRPAIERLLYRPAFSSCTKGRQCLINKVPSKGLCCSSQCQRRPFSSSGPSAEKGEKGLSEEELRVLVELEKEEQDFRKKNAKTNNDKVETDEEIRLQESISEAFVPFQDQQRIIQDVIDEIWNPIPQPETPVYQPPAEFLERGKTGVFDLQELLDLLRDENCEEIVTISIPKEMKYADYFVIVTCKSPRHLLASATYARKRYKMKDLKRTDTIPRTISKDGQQGWIALDFGNIILHLFLQKQRDHFDLEMLWTVGPFYDDLCNTEDPDIIQLLNAIK